MSDICDRCNKPVFSVENVAELQSIIQSDPLLSFTLGKTRHIRCSPSSAQWIVHPNFPSIVDQRPKYDKNQYSAKKRKIFEKKYTDAWLLLVERDKEVEDSTIDLLNLDP